MYTDETVIQFGKHKGQKLANVPDAWLLWYYENATKPDPKLIEYITQNLDVLK